MSKMRYDNGKKRRGRHHTVIGDAKLVIKALRKIDPDIECAFKWIDGSAHFNLGVRVLFSYGQGCLFVKVVGPTGSQLLWIATTEPSELRETLQEKLSRKGKFNYLFGELKRPQNDSP